MKRVLLQAPGFLGDEVVFTGAVRELALQTGWSFRVNTQRPDLWLHPGSKAGVGAVGGEDIVLTNHHCPPFRRMDEAPLHFLEQYVRNLRSALGLEGDHRISRFGGEVGLTQEEIAQGPPLGLDRKSVV